MVNKPESEFKFPKINVGFLKFISFELILFSFDIILLCNWYISNLTLTRFSKHHLHPILTWRKVRQYV